MKKYPLLEIELGALASNIQLITGMAKDQGIDIAGVIKGFNAIPELVDVIDKSECRWIASSRMKHFEALQEREFTKPFMLIRLPMQSEVEEVIRYCRISMNSEKNVLDSLNREAGKQNKIHQVILMYDLGDLREGIFDEDAFIKLALYVEGELENLMLYGIGSNLSCYGSVLPTVENLSKLVEVGRSIEKEIGHSLEIISGGATTSFPLIYNKSMPKGINQLRLGEGITCAKDYKAFLNSPIDGLNEEVFTLKVEVIEVNKKPTYPVGDLGRDAFGNQPVYEDRGERMRAILAIGNQDLGDVTKLIPRDKDSFVLGGSSDHMIVDIEDTEIDYKVGDVMSFDICYQAMLFATESPHVKKIMI